MQGGVQVMVEDGVAHVQVSFQNDGDVGNNLLLVIRHLEARLPVILHGVPPCVVPSAFELVDLEYEGVKAPICQQCPLEKQCPGFPQEYLEQKAVPSKPFIPLLREVGIEVNRSCLFSCPFCFYQHFYEKESQEFVPQEKIRSLIDEAAASGAGMVRFFGGDPVLRRDFPDLLAYAKSKDLFTIINTNGLFLDESSRARIVSLADAIVVSLQGCDEHSAMMLTGKQDLFVPVLVAIRRLAKEAPEKLMVSTIISSFVLQHRDRYGALLSKLGVTSWSLNRPLYSPEEAKALPWLQYSPHDVAGLAVWAKKASQESGISIIVNNLPWCAVPPLARSVVRHNAQTNSMTRVFVDIKGFVKAGPSNPSPLGSTIQEGWQNNQFRFIGEGATVPPECLSCSVYLQCLGGSRNQAFWASGSYNGRDPWMVGAIHKQTKADAEEGAGVGEGAQIMEES